MTLHLNIEPLHDWMPCGTKPCIIAGPCSAETEEQVIDTAKKLVKIPMVKVLRAGLWKPRTRPGAFEGVGDKGLKWLQRVQAETGLKVTTEVANPVHVEKAMKAGIDILWLGARTVVNPFSVQEISEALKGVDIPIMIKNPLNPDLTTWMGALERISKVGIRKLVAIHRGFSFYQHSPFRNDPMWEIPIELKRLFPELPVIVDPSHICGTRDLLLSVSQRAIDLEMTGLMIEVHNRPKEALTDRQQQITPEHLTSLLSKLIIREPIGSDEFQNLLEELRSEIDKIDQQLIDILARRMTIVEEIGKYKKANKITILQLKRWNQIFSERIHTGQELGLSKEFIMKLLEAVHEESIQKQIDVMNKKD
ncbi:MAG: bifunctional 3-deoxy-7-phosphoheptulonate synthase/chorismate mutase type II [Bacteroidales bacterium]|nr:bifunctional 3-deoxy-7-phosphoheptulonate synthase/chorismate mutase type II [Bacteroidota bacterium]MBL6950419.1 bifunctional 3-deoxy-7-phosphoheptulonate synthase/chorismate mutase type II [Bacteroidales bacterium]